MKEKLTKKELFAKLELKDYEKIQEFVYYSESGIDHAIWVKCEMFSDDVESFLKKNKLESKLDKENRILKNFNLAHVDWWKPDSLNPHTSINYTNNSKKPYFGLSIIFGEQKENFTTFYIFRTSL